MEEQTLTALLLDTVGCRSCQPGELLFCQGDEAEAFYYLVSGLTQAFSVMPDGSTRNIMTTWPGNFFATSTFFEGAPRRCSEIVRAPSRICVITRESYETLRLARPEFVSMVLRSLALDVGTLQEQLVDSSLLDVNVNVARFLCRRIADTREPRPTVRFSQDFIANTLGISRWAVNKALMHLKSMGWISTGYACVLVEKPEELRDYAYGEA